MKKMMLLGALSALLLTSCHTLTPNHNDEKCAQIRQQLFVVQKHHNVALRHELLKSYQRNDCAQN